MQKCKLMQCLLEYAFIRIESIFWVNVNLAKKINLDPQFRIFLYCFKLQINKVTLL